VPLHVASAWTVIGSKCLLVLSADGGLRRFVRTYWIITPSPSAFANAPGKQVNNKEVEIWDQSPSYAAFAATPLLVLFSALLGLCEVLKTLCLCSNDALLGDVLSSSQRNSVFLVTSKF
jgi:hypothetical protein